MDAKINIFNETNHKFIPKKKLTQIAKNCLILEKFHLEILNIIFMSDIDIQKLNKEYLGHDYATDVISFKLEGNSENESIGEIYISIDTAELQAKEYKVSLSNELLRLTAHGLLHICGYEDDSIELKEIMKNKENELLSAII